MDVEVSPTKKVLILGMEKRELNNMVWCAITYEVNRLFWIDGYLLCLEVYEKSFEEEIKDRVFPISQVCYAKLPNYMRIYKVEGGGQIPVVNASDMKLFRSILEAVTKAEVASL